MDSLFDMAAIRNKETKILELLLAHEKVDLDKRDESGRTILQMAIMRSNVTTARFLLSKGANPNIADEELFSAKDGSVYKQMVSGGARSKQINTNNVQRASSGYMLSERLEKDIDSGRGSLNHSRLSNLPSTRGAYNCASSTSGASDCSR